MGIKSYEENGKKLWQVYVNLRSKLNPRVRVQRTVKGLSSEAAARREETKILQELSRKVMEDEGTIIFWCDIIAAWNEAVRKGHTVEYSPASLSEYNSILNYWTSQWMKRSAGEITRADGRELMKLLNENNLSVARIIKIKNTINVVYMWGIEEGLIKGVTASPVFGIKLNKKKERVPDILTLDEIKRFLEVAKVQGHEWYPVWAGALLTGMRNGELYSLLWDDVDFENEIIRVSKSYDKVSKEFKSTKAGYWRNIPISSELKNLLIELKLKDGISKFVFPRFQDWETGMQSKILKAFLKGNNFPEIRFHALRACFATQLLARGTAPAIVMKICGWRDLKTMEYYVRVAGVDEKGATEGLKILPKASEAYGEIVQLSDFKGQ